MNSIRYCYDAATGEYTAAVSCALSPARPFDADGNPVFLEPANCAAVAPPAKSAGEAAVYEGDAWRIVPDLRGRIVFRKQGGAPVRLAALGPLPAELTLAEPPSSEHEFNEAAGGWELCLAKAETEARARRNALLAGCDWTQLPDTALGEPVRTAWRAYRQALRDHMAGWTPDKPWPESPDMGS